MRPTPNELSALLGRVIEVESETRALRAEIEQRLIERKRLVVEHLAPLRRPTRRGAPMRLEELIAAGVIRPPLEAGDPTEDWPDIRLPRGTAAALIDADRGET